MDWHSVVPPEPKEDMIKEDAALVRLPLAWGKPFHQYQDLGKRSILISLDRGDVRWIETRAWRQKLSAGRS